ncbi:MAG TPA: SurA N-terminal domain-containing protein [Clostridiaceae bacterium]
MRYIKGLTIVLLGSLVLSISGCGLLTKTPEAIAKSPVGKVNGVIITKAEFQKRLDQNISSLNSQYGADFDKSDTGKQYVAQLKTNLIGQMESEVLLVQKAKELKLDSDTSKIDTEVKTQIDSIKKDNYAGDEAKYVAAIKSAGYTEASFPLEIRRQVIINNVLDYIDKDVTVSDAEIKDYYDKNPYEFTEKPNTIKLLHINVATEAEAIAVLARLKNKEDFAAVAKEVSLDTATKDKGGDLGDVPYLNSGLEEAFMTAAIKLKDGTVSDPVTLTSGFDIIKAVSRAEFPEKTLAAVTDTIKSEVTTTKNTAAQNAKITEWTKVAKITTYTNNL